MGKSKIKNVNLFYKNCITKILEKADLSKLAMSYNLRENIRCYQAKIKNSNSH